MPALTPLRTLSALVPNVAATIRVCCLALALTACRQRFDDSNLKVVNDELDRSEKQARQGGRETGVSPKEVESILGPPTRVETTRLPLETQKKEVEVTRYYYQQDGQTVELHFFDNKLITRVPLLGSAKPTKDQP